jgi:hypothetical protein
MTPAELTHFISNLTFEQIERVYVGKENACTCGCKGEHTLTSEDLEGVRKVLRKVKKECCKNQKVPEIGGRVIQLVDKGRVYALILTKEAF